MSPHAALLVFVFLVWGVCADRDDRWGFPNMFTRRPFNDAPKTCSCTCGDRNLDGRIVNGVNAKTNEFPWIVRLSYFNRFYCAGMLINDRYVLTAAHCVKGFMWFMIKVTFGEHDRCDTSVKPETRFVLRATTGDFSYLNFNNDIAILRLNDRVPITDTISPICLPKHIDDQYVGVKAIAAGWGTLKEDGKPACILQEVELPVMSNEQCKSTNYTAKMISENMLCAGYKEGGKDSCQGDSGGPLITEKADKRYELVGVVSWGNGCARPGFPGIYTRVTRYLDWIRSNTAEACWCDDVPKATEKPTTEQTTEKVEITLEKHEEGTTEKTGNMTTEKVEEEATKKQGEELDEIKKTSEAGPTR